MFFLEHTESTTMVSGRDPPPFTEEQLHYLTDLVGRRPRDRSRSPRTHRARSASPGSSRRRREAVRPKGEFSTIIVILCYVMSDRWEARMWLGGRAWAGPVAWVMAHVWGPSSRCLFLRRLPFCWLA